MVGGKLAMVGGKLAMVGLVWLGCLGWVGLTYHTIASYHGPLKGDLATCRLSFKKDMHGWPGPFFGTIIFLVFLKNNYKNMVFGGPNHSHRDRLSQAVILVRWGCSPS